MYRQMLAALMIGSLSGCMSISLPKVDKGMTAEASDLARSRSWPQAVKKSESIDPVTGVKRQIFCQYLGGEIVSVMVEEQKDDRVVDVQYVTRF